MKTPCITEPTYVTDPQPTLAAADVDHCQFTKYPNADEVVFCTNPPAIILTGPCCAAMTLACDDCYNQLAAGAFKFWQCIACGKKTTGRDQPFKVIRL